MRHCERSLRRGEWFRQVNLRAAHHSSDANLIGHHLASTCLKSFIFAAITRHAESIHAWRGSYLLPIWHLGCREPGVGDRVDPGLATEK